MSSIYDNVRGYRQFSAATGLTKAEFNTLYAIFEPYYTPKTKDEDAYGQDPVLTNKKEALFFCAVYV